ncbi:hypothetical protein [Clostridium sp.]|uniref:hypothetical protein n=1 Tax=Clostridium sp. TaxID=1506 RepID=UPI003D6D970E
MFPAFSSRLPDKRIRDVKEILIKYGLEKYDVFELLKKNGGKLPIDSLKFIEPIYLDEKMLANNNFQLLLRPPRSYP